MLRAEEICRGGSEHRQLSTEAPVDDEDERVEEDPLFAPEISSSTRRTQMPSLFAWFCEPLQDVRGGAHRVGDVERAPPGWKQPPISLFCDELTPEPSRQIEVLVDLELEHVDLRSAWNVDILALDQERLGRLAILFVGAGIRVACLATRIGKRMRVDETERLETALARAFAMAELFEVRLIRIFGFLAPAGEGVEPATVREVTDRLGAFAACADRRGVTLLLETERGLVVDGPDPALDVLRAVDSPALRYIWDAGNMVDLGISRPTERWFDLLAPYVEYVHVKDGRLGASHTCYPGAGDGQVRELLTRLCGRGYRGVLSLEPNVGRLAEFGGDRTAAVGGALRALRALLRAGSHAEPTS